MQAGRNVNREMSYFIYEQRSLPVELYKHDSAGILPGKCICGQRITSTYGCTNLLVHLICGGRVIEYEYDAVGRLVKEEINVIIISIRTEWFR